MTEYRKVVDVSRHNGELDFVKMVAAGVDGIAIRATVGDYYTDPRFYENWSKAEAAGIYRTAYHVIRPRCDPKAQMARFFDVLGARRPVFGKYGWVMDCEVLDGQTKAKDHGLYLAWGERCQPARRQGCIHLYPNVLLEPCGESILELEAMAIVGGEVHDCSGSVVWERSVIPAAA